MPLTQIIQPQSGFVDRTGVIAMVARYDQSPAVRIALALVKSGDPVACIDRQGKVVREMELPGRAGLLLRM